MPNCNRRCNWYSSHLSTLLCASNTATGRSSMMATWTSKWIQIKASFLQIDCQQLGRVYRRGSLSCRSIIAYGIELERLHRKRVHGRWVTETERDLMRRQHRVVSSGVDWLLLGQQQQPIYRENPPAVFATPASKLQWCCAKRNNNNNLWKHYKTRTCMHPCNIYELGRHNTSILL